MFSLVIISIFQTWWGFPADHKALGLGGCWGWLLPRELWAALRGCKDGGRTRGVRWAVQGAEHPGVTTGSATDHRGGLPGCGGPWRSLGTRMVPPHWRLVGGKS